MSTLIVKNLDAPTGESIVAPDLQLPQGSVVQVQTEVYGTTVYSASSNFSDSGLSITFTPLFANSTLHIFVNQAGIYADGSNTGGVDLKLYRDSTDLGTFAGRVAGDRPSSTTISAGSACTAHVESAGSTASRVYKTRFRAVSNASAGYCQVYSADSNITVMEIAG